MNNNNEIEYKIIDSAVLIDRMTEIESELQNKCYINALEYKELKELETNCKKISTEAASNFYYGTELIRKDYFNEYQYNKIISSLELPDDTIPDFMKIDINYDLLLAEFESVFFHGQEYLIRSY